MIVSWPCVCVCVWGWFSCVNISYGISVKCAWKSPQQPQIKSSTYSNFPRLDGRVKRNYCFMGSLFLGFLSRIFGGAVTQKWYMSRCFAYGWMEQWRNNLWKIKINPGFRWTQDRQKSDWWHEHFRFKPDPDDFKHILIGHASVLWLLSTFLSLLFWFHILYQTKITLHLLVFFLLIKWSFNSPGLDGNYIRIVSIEIFFKYWLSLHFHI